MNTELLEKKFRAIGAQLRFRNLPRGRGDTGYNIDIVQSKKGESFSLQYWGAGDTINLDVIDVRPELRHLLLLDRDSGAKTLAGRDERHWFLASVPEHGVRGVQDAMDALKPEEVRDAAKGLKRKHRNKRRNNAFIRQGEWFFTPSPRVDINEKLILESEPLIRSGRRGGTPHVCQFLYRIGGELVYIRRGRLSSIMNPLNHDAYTQMMRDPRVSPTEKAGWSQQKVNMDVYVKGKVTHPDHATIVLDIWHKVSMNTEGAAAFAGEQILFID